MSRKYDVIVVGVGAMGASACWQLARRGVRVLGLEQFSVPHALGSSHGDSRMIRLCYFEHPDYVPLLRRAYELWRELEAETGRALLHLTGGVYLGRADGGFVQATLKSAQAHGLPHERLDRAELGRRFPPFRLPDGYEAVYEPNAGLLLAESAVSALAERALRCGAEIHAIEPVLSWSEDGQGIRVTTSRDTYSTQRLALCAGAWSERLAADLGAPLHVTRQPLGWVWPRRPELFELGRFPVWAIDQPDGTQHYGFPMIPLSPGLKVAHHARGPVTMPESIDRQPKPQDADDFMPALRAVLPEGDGPLLAIRICMYTCTPDTHFIIGLHPRRPAVIIACGFSGHGFKFASVIGQIIADLALDGRSRLPIGFLSPMRFAGG
jgi:sarcosine oxidase